MKVIVNATIINYTIYILGKKTGPKERITFFNLLDFVKKAG